MTKREENISDEEWYRILGETPPDDTFPDRLNKAGDRRGLSGNSHKTQFASGRSGNPRGRPKGIPNLRTSAQKMLAQPVNVRNGNRNRKISTQEAALLKLREKALAGDNRALFKCLELSGIFNNEEERTSVGPKLTREEQEMLARAKARFNLEQDDYHSPGKPVPDQVNDGEGEDDE